MRYLLLSLLAFTCLLKAQGQSIPKDDQPRFMAEGAEPGKRTGTVLVTFGVSMSDCIRSVEIENLENKRKYVLYPTLDHYYVRDSDMEEIYAKIPVGKMRRLVSKKEGLHAKITVISKSGRAVYTGKADFKIEPKAQEKPEDERTASR